MLEKKDELLTNKEWLEEKADQEKVRQAEIENFRIANGFSDEDDELAEWKNTHK